MIASWYDVLGVDDDATADEIRAAWQEAVAGLDPTDRRFKQRNRAAEVLLDPTRRARHDAELAAQDEAEATAADDVDDAAVVEAAVVEASDRDEPAGGSDPADVAVDEQVSLAKSSATRTDDDTDDDTDAAAAPVTDAAARTGRGGLVVTVALGVLAVLAVVAVVVALVSGGGAAPSAADDGQPDARAVQAARTAAEAAAGPVISYDYRSLDESRAAAVSYMTPAYADVYEQNFAVVEDNAARTETIVTAEVIGSGVVRTGRDRVDVLVFVNRPTRNASTDTVYRDQVTLRMLDVDGRWLVDCLIASPGDSCGD